MYHLFSNDMDVRVYTGACDGEIRLWDLSRRSCVWRAVGHRGFVRGLAVTPDGESFLSAGDDGMVKQWDLGVASDLTQVIMPPRSARMQRGMNTRLFRRSSLYLLLLVVLTIVLGRGARWGDTACCRSGGCSGGVVLACEQRWDTAEAKSTSP